MAIIDITPAISARMPVFPGDTKFAAERSWEISNDVPDELIAPPLKLAGLDAAPVRALLRTSS